MFLMIKTWTTKDKNCDRLSILLTLLKISEIILCLSQFYDKHRDYRLSGTLFPLLHHLLLVQKQDIDLRF